MLSTLNKGVIKIPLNINNAKGEKVIDPYKNAEKYKKWNKKIKGISKENEKIILQYLEDMENGRNVSSVKGCRSYSRLNSARSRMTVVAKLFEKYTNKNLVDLTDEDVDIPFNKMRKGTIKKNNGQPYKAVADYVVIFKAFWNWYKKVMRKKGKTIPNITEDLDTSKEKPTFNYFTFDQLKKLCDNAKYDYKVLMWFLFDTGIRAPTELLNVKGKDLIEDEKSSYSQLNIRNETSKTFGRKIKLMLCSDVIKKYIKNKNIKSEDFLFKIDQRVTNQYLKRLGEKILGLKNLTLYDFRHSSCCYWLPRYKSESALKYRFGWKKSDMIYYYSEFLGMKDTITENDLIDDETKTLLERELGEEKKKVELLEEEVKNIINQIEKIKEYTPLLRTIEASPRALNIIKEEMIKQKNS